MINLGPRLGFVDRPDDELKTHAHPAVPLGGVGLFFGLLVGAWLGGLVDLGLTVGATAVWSMGLIDDRLGLSPRTRLAGAIVIGLAMAAFASIDGGLMVWLLVAIVVAVSVNAVNMLDGLDALAGSVTIAICLGLAALAVLEDDLDPVAPLVLAGAVLGFLLWNLPRARLFLGDSGAYVIGLTLVWLAFRGDPDPATIVLALGLVGVPVLELGATVLRRTLDGRRLFGGDRDHSYDLLHRSSWSAGSIAAVLGLAQILWAVLLLSALVFWGAWPAVVTAASTAVLVVLFLATRLRQAVASED